MKVVATARGGCPTCGATPPVKLAFWGRGKLFQCKECGSNLNVPRVGMRLALAGTALLLVMAQSAPLWLLAIFVALIGAIEFLLMRVQLVEPNGGTEQDVRKPIDER